jgi:hypothetical protein
MRYIVTAESTADGRAPRFPESKMVEMLRRHGLRLVAIERQMMPLIFVAWQRRGGHWQAIAAGVTKRDVHQAVQGVEGVVVLPLGVSP